MTAALSPAQDRADDQPAHRPRVPGGAGSVVHPSQIAVSRRCVAKGIAAGAATVVVAGTGVLSYRVFDNGVLDTDGGRALDPWRRCRDTDGPLGAVAAAVLAANPHNSQPWAFRVTDTAVEVYADTARGTGTLDAAGREMYVGLGCAIENLVLAARARGLAPTLTLLPDGPGSDLLLHHRGAAVAHSGPLLLLGAALCVGSWGEAAVVMHRNWSQVLLAALGGCELVMAAGAAPVVMVVGAVGGAALIMAASVAGHRRSLAAGLMMLGTAPFAALAWTALVPVLVLLLVAALAAPVLSAPERGETARQHPARRDPWA